MKITYQLRPEEIEEAWISAQWRVGIFQKWNQLLLTVIALGLVFAYARKPDRFYLMMCAVPVVILLFCNSYLLRIVRRRRACRLAKKKGIYGVEIRKNGICAGKDWTFYPLKDRRWEMQMCIRDSRRAVLQWRESEPRYAITKIKEKGVFCYGNYW